MNILLGYFALINVITFVVRGVDKRRAVAKEWRVSENVLLLLSGLGGFIGAIAGMQLFRHKTIKGKFLIWFWLIVGVWITIYIVVLSQQ